MTTTISGTTGCSQVVDGSITQADLAAPYYLPSPQTWQNVKASRALATNYTNSTGQPIEVQVALSSTGANNTAIATVDGVSLTGSVSPNTVASAYIAFKVPNNSVYSVTGNVAVATIYTWAELR